jgi:aspartate-semialdehyde dehydrogenase
VYDHLAVVGATGAVGRLALRLIEERNLPYKTIKFLASKRSAGKTITFKGQEHPVEELRP